MQVEVCASPSPAYFMVRPAGFEPAAYGFEVRRSIQLSYGRMLERTAEIRKQMTDLRLTVSPRQAEAKKRNLVPDSTQNYIYSRLNI